MARGFSKGVRVFNLEPGDKVASVALAGEVAGVSKTPPHGPNPQEWPGGRVALFEGEEPTQITVLHPMLPLEAIRLGGGSPPPTGRRPRSTSTRATGATTADASTPPPTPCTRA
jgi:hypothetical protein